MSRPVECKIILDLDKKADRDFLRRFLEPINTEPSNDDVNPPSDLKTTKEPIITAEDIRAVVKRMNESKTTKASSDQKSEKIEFKSKPMPSFDVVDHQKQAFIHHEGLSGLSEKEITGAQYTKLQVQEMLAKKNNSNAKAVLKEKLNSFGASKFSELKPKDYAEFYQFMETL